MRGLSFAPIVPALAALGVALVLLVISPKSGRLRRAALLALVAAMATQPVIGGSGAGHDSNRAGNGLDVVFLIDRTTSMAAEDFSGGKPRLAGVRQDVTSIVEDMPGASFSVVAVDNSGRVEVPFTTDGSAIIATVDAMAWREARHGDGSDLARGVEVAKSQLELSRREDPSRRRYLVYLGDGEQTTGGAPHGFEDLRALVTGGLVLGYGTPDGGRMRVRPGATDYVQFEGKDAISSADPGNLAAIAEQIGGDYLHRDGTGRVPAPERRDPDIAHGQQEGTSLAWLLALAAVPLVAWELWRWAVAARRAWKEFL